MTSKSVEDQGGCSNIDFNLSFTEPSPYLSWDNELEYVLKALDDAPMVNSAPFYDEASAFNQNRCSFLQSKLGNDSEYPLDYGCDFSSTPNLVLSPITSEFDDLRWSDIFSFDSYYASESRADLRPQTTENKSGKGEREANNIEGLSLQEQLEADVDPENKPVGQPSPSSCSSIVEASLIFSQNSLTSIKSSQSLHSCATEFPSPTFKVLETEDSYLEYRTNNNNADRILFSQVLLSPSMSKQGTNLDISENDKAHTVKCCKKPLTKNHNKVVDNTFSTWILKMTSATPVNQIPVNIDAFIPACTSSFRNETQKLSKGLRIEFYFSDFELTAFLDPKIPKGNTIHQKTEIFKSYLKNLLNEHIDPRLARQKAKKPVDCLRKKRVKKEIKEDKCPICSKLLSSKPSNMIRHINSFHKGFKYLCNTCGKEIKYPGDLKRHIKHMHSSS
ncbi:expressed protein [Phakopsora pachyrhizi]|uniref:Expressed protein n=1 Tax=Phakopsora pachyrhizi TaxID=170000 RepID=A0AAV0B7N4_PHAPC|nr:expressed protein [Phakopsora pachyrhizi]